VHPGPAPAAPLATYRLQLHRGFGFDAAARVVAPLAALGISDCYLSPISRAFPGSPHGYDVIEHGDVNPELGGFEALERFAGALAARGMGLVLDVVPNHMSVAGALNPWWRDVLESGRGSRFAGHFDVDWNPPKPDLAGKVLLPVLGDQFGRVLERELAVGFEAGAFHLRHGETAYPLAPRSWTLILAPAADALRARLGPEAEPVLELESILTALGQLPHRAETGPERRRHREREKEIVRRRLSELCAGAPEAAAAIEAAVREVNGRRGEPRSFDALERVVDEQAYRLAFWKVAADEINYRRFFDVNELAAIRVEEAAVFEAVHALPLRCAARGWVTGLRIDHVDGLFDPEKYLCDLQAAWPREGGRAPWIVVEKILGPHETLPESWPVAGTTGYDFLNLVAGVLVDRRAEGRLRALAGAVQRFSDVAYESRLVVLRSSLSAELTVLARRLDRLSEQVRYFRDFTLNSLLIALAHVVASFPVYRTYVRPGGAGPGERDREAVKSAVRAAARRNPATSREVFDFLRDLLLLDDPEGLTGAQSAERRDFVLRLQQLTPPVMAKGVEDTAFYRWFPLAALNEVGGDPTRFGVTVEAFHRENAARLERMALGLSATATHDAKRGEDTRARMLVLSEQPEAWARAVERWRELNRAHRVEVGGVEAPDGDEEYLLYQTLAGAWPVGGLRAEPGFVERIQAYLEKAQREAKRHTSWVSPDEAWEQAVRGFVAAALDPARSGAFLADFARFHPRIERAGWWNGLAQVLLKVASPGVPDFYQGTELWDLSLVDPDNRRPVDFELRRRLLDGLARAEARDRGALLRRLVARPEDGRVKLWVTSRALACRARARDVFERGSYVAVAAEGARAEQVVAFARERDGRVVVAVAGRFFTRLGRAVARPLGGAWGDTRPRRPAGLARAPLRDALTGGTLAPDAEGALPLAAVFASLPVALLES
jgi:(1->4)-alpha-D-glucan 1-alpha-D-glucosylmutase